MEGRFSGASPSDGPPSQPAVALGSENEGAAAPELTERPEVQQLLAEMKRDLAPGEDPLYYDWTERDSPAAGDGHRDYVSTKPARPHHITIDAQKVKIAESARNPARTAKTAQFPPKRHADPAAVAAAERVALSAAAEAERSAAAAARVFREPSEPAALESTAEATELPGAEPPGTASSPSERPKPSSVPPSGHAQQARRRILIAALAATGGLGLLWALSRGPVDTASNESPSVSVPNQTADAPAVTPPSAGEGTAASEPAGELVDARAATAQPTVGTAPSAAPAPARSPRPAPAAATHRSPRPRQDDTGASSANPARDKPELVEHDSGG